MCDRLVVVVCVVFCSLQRSLCSFSLSAPPSSVAVNSLNGEVFVAAGTELVRLSQDLELLETAVVEGELVRIALSPDGGRLVGCLGGDTRTCFVYDTSNLTTGPSATVEDAHYNPENGLAIIATTDTFYLGSEGSSGLGNDNMFLAQYNYTSEVVRTTGAARFRIENSRQFYGGVSWNNYVYYFVADRGSDDDIRVLRVCDCARHPCTSEFEALYELTLECRSSATDSTRVCGVDLVESFAGLTGPLVVVTRCEEDREQPRNRACAFRLADIDGDMDAYLTGCRSGMHSESDLPWHVSFPCSLFTVSNVLKMTETHTFYHYRKQPLVILAFLPLSMWKRLLNPHRNDLGFIWSKLALTLLLPLWPSLLRVSVYCMWPLMEPLNW